MASNMDRPSLVMASFEYSIPSRTVNPLLSPRYNAVLMPSIPNVEDAPIRLPERENSGTTRRLRQRTLSECGRSLFLSSYAGDSSATWEEAYNNLPQSPKPQATEKTVRATVIAPRNTKVKKADDTEATKRSNLFTALYDDSSSDDDSEVLDVLARNKKLIYSKQSSPKNSSIRKIDECLHGEMDVNDEWETVTSSKKKDKSSRPKPAQETAISPHKTKFAGYNYDSDEYDDGMHEFHEQIARQVGSERKTHQFKAVEKRNYAINKRNKQRGYCK